MEEKIQCEACGEGVHSYDVINYGSIDHGYRQLCSRCFNADVARLNGLEDFENVRLEPIGIVGCDGETHQFHFQTRLLGNIVALDAFELQDGNPAGYEFQVIGDPEDDSFVLLTRMIEKIRRALSIKHVENDGGGLQIVDQTVRGRIESDASKADRMPLIVVDGQEISWEEFGKMLMTFERWQFKLEIADLSDEL